MKAAMESSPGGCGAVQIGEAAVVGSLLSHAQVLCMGACACLMVQLWPAVRRGGLCSSCFVLRICSMLSCCGKLSGVDPHLKLDGWRANRLKEAGAA